MPEDTNSLDGARIIAQIAVYTKSCAASEVEQTTVNFLNIRTPKKICCNHSKIKTMWLYHRVMSPNDTDGMTNSVDPDQTAPLGAV